MTALTQREAAQGLNSPGLTADQVALIKRTLMSAKREPTDDELALFVHQCNRTGLDPFSDQIYAIYRWDRRAQDEVMKVQVSIHGLRLVADRTRSYAPGNEYWCGEDGVWRDVWMDDANPPKAARVTVRKLVGGQLIEFSVPARWKEFAPYDSQGRLSAMWQRMPGLMLAKCSEALALRKAFPAETSGLYIREELDQADADRGEAVVEEIKQTFQATEEPAPAQEWNEAAAHQAAAEAAATPPTNGGDPNAVLTPEQAEQTTTFLSEHGVPEPMVHFAVIGYGKDSIAELTVAEAQKLMQDAQDRGFTRES